MLVVSSLLWGLNHVCSIQVGLVGVVVLVYPVGLLFAGWFRMINRGVGGVGPNIVPVPGCAGGVVSSVAVGACQVAVSVVPLGRVGVLRW